MTVLPRGVRAGGGGGAPVDLTQERLHVVRGFADGVNIKSPDGTLRGAATMTLMWLGRLGMVQPLGGGGDEGVLVAHGTTFFTGYALGYSPARPYVEMIDDGTSGRLSTAFFGATWGWDSLDGESGYQMANLKHAVMGFVRNGTALTLWVAGVKWRTINFGGAGYAPGGPAGQDGITIGTHVDGTVPLTNGGWAGLGYAETAFTDAQMRDATMAWMDALDSVQVGSLFSHLYSVKSLELAHGAVLPTSIPDLVGDVDLVHSEGSALTVHHERHRFL